MPPAEIGKTGHFRTTIVVLDEDSGVRAIAANIIRHGGIEVYAVGTSEEALALMRVAAPRRVLLLLSSSLAEYLDGAVTMLTQHDPPPCVLFVCVDPHGCAYHRGPTFKELSCQEHGCLQKPGDFVAGRLLSRVHEIIESNDSPNDPVRQSDHVKGTAISA